MNRKRAISWTLLAGGCALALVCAVAVAIYLFAFGERESLSTNTYSTQLETSAERVAFLGRYLKLRTPATDAAFHIVYHDNSSGGLPGPSDWWIAATIQVTPADGPTWLAGASPLGSNDTLRARMPATAGLIPPEWHVSSTGESYARDGARVVWHPEGVLEFAASTE